MGKGYEVRKKDGTTETKRLLMTDLSNIILDENIISAKYICE